MSRPSTFTKPGAMNLAQKIERYWKLKGYKVHTHVIGYGIDDRFYCVRSDMKNGLPRDFIR